MKKHVAGIVLFALIITLSAVGYNFFRTEPIPEIGTVEILEIPDRKAACFSEFHRVRIVQAIANVSDNTLTLDLGDAANDSKSGSISCATTMVLSFYNVNTVGPQFVRSEVIEIEPNLWLNRSAGKAIKYKRRWFEDNIGPLNFYVSACVVGSECDINNVPPFSKESSTPVLLVAR